MGTECDGAVALSFAQPTGKNFENQVLFLTTTVGDTEMFEPLAKQRVRVLWSFCNL